MCRCHCPGQCRPKHKGVRPVRTGPAKLLRMGGHLYKVAGSGPKRKLQRQVTPRRLAPVQAARFERRGHTLRRMTSSPMSSSLGRSAANAIARARTHARPSMLRSSPQALASSAMRKASISVQPAGSVLLLRARYPLGGPRARQGRHAPQIFCPIFCRTGGCPLRAQDSCHLVHDTSKVAVCPAWLAGSCKRGLACRLQHTAVRELMPLCTFFMQVLEQITPLALSQGAQSQKSPTRSASRVMVGERCALNQAVQRCY